MVKIKLDINKTVNENAAIYFEKSKKAKHKLEGALEAIENTKKKLKKAEKEKLKKEKLEEQNKKVKVHRKKHWYEKFRWFISSEGFLVIGGRDATSNEIIVKKHTDEGDLVFHTDMAGSPFFVIKKSSVKNKEIGEHTIKETADATCTFSKAWKIGLNTTSTFWVKPDQVTKEAQSGEYLAKGSFMIRGKTNYIDSEINLAVGLKEENQMIVYGPKSSVIKQTKNYVEVIQGNFKKGALIKKIHSKLKGGDYNEIMMALPAGDGDVKK